MRIVIWSPNYAPELTGIPPLVTDACRWLAARGHEVEVVTAFPNYPQRRIDLAYRGSLWRSEVLDGVGVHRSWLRVRPGESFLDKALYEASFTALSLPRVIRRVRQADVIVCVIPTLGAATVSALVRRTLGRPRLVFWVQDLVLSGAAALSLGEGASRAIEAFGVAERFAAKQADTVIVCSPGFKDYFIDRGVQPERIETILNWADVDRIEPAPVSNGSGPTRFLYAGNLGYSQGFETLLDAAVICGDDAEVRIVGAGNAANHVRDLANDLANVSVGDPVARKDYPDLLGRADAHIVLQRRVSAGANLPSKIATYMASGRPIVASIDLETPAADLLRESGGAILVEPESPERLAEAMRSLGAPTVRKELGERAREFAVRSFAKEPALARLEAAIVG